MSDNESTVRQMIKESSRMWLDAMDRSEAGSGPIIITDSPDWATYLERRENYTGDFASIDGWLLTVQPLRAIDAESFYASFGSSWPLLLKCYLQINDEPKKIRALIKNGRSPDWTISLDISTKL